MVKIYLSLRIILKVPQRRSQTLWRFLMFTPLVLTSNIFNFKSKGYSPVLLRRMLIFMHFPGDRNIHNLFSTYYKLFYEGKKDSLYDILHSEKINLRVPLLNFAKRFMKKIYENHGKPQTTFFIVDDTGLL